MGYNIELVRGQLPLQPMHAKAVGALLSPKA